MPNFRNTKHKQKAGLDTVANKSKELIHKHKGRNTTNEMKARSNKEM